MREIAERVLFAEKLDEKLRFGPLTVSDSQRGRPLALPVGPGRPKQLRVRRDGVRVDFPGVNRLDDARERGCFRDRAARPEGWTTPPTDPDERNERIRFLEVVVSLHFGVYDMSRD